MMRPLSLFAAAFAFGLAALAAPAEARPLAQRSGLVAQAQYLPGQDGNFGWRQPTYRDSWPGGRMRPLPRPELSPPAYREPAPYVDRYVPGQRAIAPRYQRRVDPLPGDHFTWCATRYRSYRNSDNTFQPFAGPRRACVSPYR